MKVCMLPHSIVKHLQVSGVPVVKSESDKTLVGVLSKKDLSKPGKTVKDVYSSPPIAARPENKVADAACLMLKHKVSSIPPSNVNLFKPVLSLECACCAQAWMYSQAD